LDCKPLFRIEPGEIARRARRRGPRARRNAAGGRSRRSNGAEIVSQRVGQGQSTKREVSVILIGPRWHLEAAFTRLSPSFWGGGQQSPRSWNPQPHDQRHGLLTYRLAPTRNDAKAVISPASRSAVRRPREPAGARARLSYAR